MEHIGSSVIVKVNVDIGKRNTVRVKESFKQQIVFNRVDLCDTKAIGHTATGSRPATGADANSELVTGGIDKILHNKEVTRKAHRLHDVQLEVYTLVKLRGKFAVSRLGPFIRQLAQIVGFKLYAVELVIASELFYFLFGFDLRQHHIAFLVTSELVKKLLLGYTAAILLLCPEIGRDVEIGHDRLMVDGIDLDLVINLHRVGQRLREVRKHLVHLIASLEPFLLGIAHTRRIIKVIIG